MMQSDNENPITVGETDLSRFRALFDSVGVKYAENGAVSVADGKRVGSLLTVGTGGDSEHGFLFDANGKFLEDV